MRSGGISGLKVIANSSIFNSSFDRFYRRAAGPNNTRPGRLSVIEHDASIDDHKAYAFGILMRVGEGRAVSYALGIKNHDVGFHTGSQHPAVMQPQALGGQGGHLANRVLQAKRAL